jgi:hypothetical protein
MTPWTCQNPEILHSSQRGSKDKDNLYNLHRSRKFETNLFICQFIEKKQNKLFVTYRKVKTKDKSFLYYNLNILINKLKNHLTNYGVKYWWFFSYSMPFFFLGGGQGLNPGPCIYYALCIPTELSSRGHSMPFIYTSNNHWCEIGGKVL